MAGGLRRLAGPAVPVVLTVDLPEPHPPARTTSTPLRHPSRPRPGRPARLTIDVVEGRGIWVELAGDLVDGSMHQVEARLDRLAQLGFEMVVVGTGGIRSIDDRGSDVLGAFVDRVCDGRGDRNSAVLIVDPNGVVGVVAHRLGRATITRAAPEGAWWRA